MPAVRCDHAWEQLGYSLTRPRRPLTTRAVVRVQWLLYRLQELGEAAAERRRADLAASYQRAIVDNLLERAERALGRTGLNRLAVGGGVAANGELRGRLAALGVEVHVPPVQLCTDNAAMIASAARYGRRLRYPDYLGLDAYASGERPL